MEKKCFLLPMLFLAITLTLNAKEIKYKVSDIPKELLLESKAVVRNSSHEFIISSDNKVISQINYAVTILNENGIDLSKFSLGYDKFTNIKKIKATVYNAQGEVIKKIGSEKIKNYSNVSEYSLFEDNRIMYVDADYRILPFTIEISYEIWSSETLNYPKWSPLIDYNVAVEKSDFQVVTPLDFELRYLEKNIEKTCILTKDKNSKIYSWSANNLKSVKYEQYSLNFEELHPTVYFAPNNFNVSGYTGNFESWEEFGKWVSKLNEGKDVLTDETKKQISELVKNEKSDIDKIKKLYRYLQDKTRYVSIQIGIGGWQPYEAEVVHKYSYGDCKSLTNYMKAILSTVGIESNYTLIRAGNQIPFFVKEFPSNQFNHALLSIPLDNDTIWLECTNQKNPFGYISTFSDDRDALMITKDGGVLIHSPVFSMNDNLKTSKTLINIDENTSSAKIMIRSKGLFYDQISNLVIKDNTDQKKQLFNYIKMSNVNIINYKYNTDLAKIPCFNLNMEISLNNHAIKLGDKNMIPLNIFKNLEQFPRQSFKRSSDIKISRPMQTIDTIIYNIPDKYIVTQIPENFSIEKEFGYYSININQQDNNLVYIRKFSIKKGIIPAKEIDDFSSFFQTIDIKDNLNFIIAKN